MCCKHATVSICDGVFFYLKNLPPSECENTKEGGKVCGTK